jgi:hypothetical protein
MVDIQDTTYGIVYGSKDKEISWNRKADWVRPLYADLEYSNFF